MSSEYLKPRASSSGKDWKRHNGMFVNQKPFPDGYGGFTSAAKVPRPGESLSLEKRPESRGSKPL